LVEKMEDEQIDTFIAKTRQLLDYIECGEDIPFSDLDGVDPDYGEG